MSQAELVRVVTYYRMSTDRQEASIPEQREAVEAYARKHGYRILREYRDEGISGDATEKRDGFKRMLADATAKGDFAIVLCWDQDRFGRFDPLEAGFWIKPLRDAGVRLETVAQGKIDWEDFAGQIIYAVQQGGKHQFLRDLSRNTTRGMLAKARAGFWLGGPPPYGYAVQGGRLVLGDPAQIEVVRWLFHTYLNTDISVRGLTASLNERRVPAPNGGLWNVAAVHKILTRPTYTGDPVWNRRRLGKYNAVEGGEIVRSRKRRQATEKSARKDWVVGKERHDPLIDRDTFERVQAKLESRRDRKTPHRGGGDFLFTRLLFCGHCGHPMHGSRLSSTKNGRNYTYIRYLCGRYNQCGKDGCRCNTLVERVLLDVVVRRIQTYFTDPVNLDLLRREVSRRLELRANCDPEAQRRLRARIKELGGQIDRGAERLLTAPADLTETLAAKLRQWQDERKRLQQDLEAMEKTEGGADAEEVNTDRVMERLGTLRERIGQADRGLLREAIRQLVVKIECWFDYVPYGTKRQKSVLRRGVISVRRDALLHRHVNGARAFAPVNWGGG
jgi:site-specific DNA recombinase